MPTATLHSFDVAISDMDAYGIMFYGRHLVYFLRAANRCLSQVETAVVKYKQPVLWNDAPITVVTKGDTQTTTDQTLDQGGRIAATASITWKKPPDTLEKLPLPVTAPFAERREFVDVFDDMKTEGGSFRADELFSILECTRTSLCGGQAVLSKLCSQQKQFVVATVELRLGAGLPSSARQSAELQSVVQIHAKPASLLVPVHHYLLSSEGTPVAVAKVSLLMKTPRGIAKHVFEAPSSVHEVQLQRGLIPMLRHHEMQGRTVVPLTVLWCHVMNSMPGFSRSAVRLLHYRGVFLAENDEAVALVAKTKSRDVKVFHQGKPVVSMSRAGSISVPRLPEHDPGAVHTELHADPHYFGLFHGPLMQHMQTIRLRNDGFVASCTNVSAGGLEGVTPLNGFLLDAVPQSALVWIMSASGRWSLPSSLDEFVQVPLFVPAAFDVHATLVSSTPSAYTFDMHVTAPGCQETLVFFKNFKFTASTDLSYTEASKTMLPPSLTNQGDGPPREADGSGQTPCC